MSRHGARQRSGQGSPLRSYTRSGRHGGSIGKSPRSWTPAVRSHLSRQRKNVAESVLRTVATRFANSGRRAGVLAERARCAKIAENSPQHEPRESAGHRGIERAIAPRVRCGGATAASEERGSLRPGFAVRVAPRSRRTRRSSEPRESAGTARRGIAHAVPPSRRSRGCARTSATRCAISRSTPAVRSRKRDKSNVRGIERGIAPPGRHGGATGAARITARRGSHANLRDAKAAKALRRTTSGAPVASLRCRILRSGVPGIASFPLARVVSQFEFLSAVRRASRAIKQERTSTESRHRRLNRWPPGGAAAGGPRRMAGHHQTRRGGGRVDTHR